MQPIICQQQLIFMLLGKYYKYAAYNLSKTVHIYVVK